MNLTRFLVTHKNHKELKGSYQKKALLFEHPLSMRFAIVSLSVLLAFSILLSLAPQQAAYADVRKADVVYGQSVEARELTVLQCPSIDAEYAYVMDSTGAVYFERNATTPVQIASITKIMTAIVALENAPLDTQIVVSADAAAIGESTAGLQAGDTMTLDQAIKALMIPSGNDAALSIAESVGSLMAGTNDPQAGETAFVEAMNNKAVEIGMTDSVFENSHGLDFGIYAGELHSTASDVAVMAQYAMQNPLFREAVGTDLTTVEVIRNGSPVSVELKSTDELLGVYEGAVGVKTGFTQLAGPCFAFAASIDGVDYYAVVLNSSSEEQRFIDSTTLVDWVQEHKQNYPLAHSPEATTMVIEGQTREVPVVAKVAHTDWIDKTVKVTLADPDASVCIFDLNGNISQALELNDVSGNVKTGDKLGTITFKQRNNVVATMDLVACENVSAPDFLQGIGIWWDRFFRGFQGQPQTAQTVTLNETPLVNDKTN